MCGMCGIAYLKASVLFNNKFEWWQLSSFILSFKTLNSIIRTKFDTGSLQVKFDNYNMKDHIDEMLFWALGPTIGYKP